MSGKKESYAVRKEQFYCELIDMVETCVNSIYFLHEFGKDFYKGNMDSVKKDGLRWLDLYEKYINMSVSNGLKTISIHNIDYYRGYYNNL